jgi:sugar lactone lactonase YvrE
VVTTRPIKCSSTRTEPGSFWNYGFNLVVFDLTAHKTTNQFNSGLTAGALASMQMSQDGSTMWFADTMGNVAILDTRYGAILGGFQGLPFSSVYPGPAY